MKALQFVPGSKPVVLNVDANHTGLVAQAIWSSVPALERVDFPGADDSQFSIYQYQHPGAAGRHNPEAEAEAERLIGERCDFSGAYVFVYANPALYRGRPYPLPDSEPMQTYQFQHLTSTDWARDYGYAKALNANPGVITYEGIPGYSTPGRPDIGTYLQREKSDYRLWQLLRYMGRNIVPQTLEYFDLPTDTLPFLEWVYNHVAHEERERVPEMQQGFFAAGEDQQNFFPYAELYRIWAQEDDQQRQARRGNVKVYLDRITEPDGRELLRYQAPSLFE